MLNILLRRMSIAKHPISSFAFIFHAFQTTTSIHKHTPNNHLFFFSSSSSSYSSMELEIEQVGHVHYNHTLPSKHPRWNARESFEFMSLRPWQPINHFYLNLVNATSSLSLLFPSQKTLIDYDDTAIPPPPFYKIDWGSVAPKISSRRWERVTFKIVLSYHGASFDGWQKQPGLNTVQSVVEASLGKFVDERKTQMLKDKGLPIEGCATVAGRTDKGVTGLQQVCAFYTWNKDVKTSDIEDAINHAAPGKLRVISVSEVTRAFHPNFSAKWRHYLYIFPLNSKGYRDQSNGNGDVSDYNGIHDSACNDELESERKSYVFSVRKVNRLLRELEGKLLSYKIFARDTKASRNEGPPTECFVYHARAMEAKLPMTDSGEETSVMCVELVANRFLRKMVRVLVATSIREAAAGAEDDALVKLMDATCRRATAPPAPADGLCLVDVGYDAFDPKKCLVHEE